MNDEPNLNGKDSPKDTPVQEDALAINEAACPENASAPEAAAVQSSDGGSAPEPDLPRSHPHHESEAVLDLPEPEPWPEPVDGALLLDDLLREASRSVVLPKWGPEAVALFTVHTYAFALRRVSAYLGVESPEKRCGKSTLLGVLGKLVSRPVVAANISSPAFFRVIQELEPTLLIDEGDSFLRRRGDLRGILNAGYTRETAYVMRVTNQKGKGEPHTTVGASRRQNPGSRLARFSCFCPKVVATIGHLPETLSDRCILIRMHRKTAREKCERRCELDWAPLRRRCARFVADHAPEIANAAPAMPSSLNDREAEIWEPLIVLADLAGGRWPQLAREAALALSASAQERNPIGSLLLDIVVILLEAEAERMFSRRLVAELNRLRERPWAALTKGKELTPLSLAGLVAPYGLRPRTIWIGDEQGKGYYKEEFLPLFQRYVPASEVKELREESRRAEVGREANQGGTESAPEAPEA
jgi:hypothetical protein